LCEGGTIAELKAFTPHPTDIAAAGNDVAITAGERRRWVLLKLEQGVLLIEVAAEDESAFDRLWPQAVTALESLRFE
jgi:hypothetical protein